MRVVEAKPGILHAFLSPEEREHIVQSDACGQWLHGVLVALIEEKKVEHNQPCFAYTFIRDNPNIP